MVNCAVFSCKRRSATSNLREHGISYHTFPKNSELAEVWVKFCKQKKNWQPTHTSVICSEHFTADSFQMLPNKRRILVKNAYPTVRSGPKEDDSKVYLKDKVNLVEKKPKVQSNKRTIQKESYYKKRVESLLLLKNKKIRRLQDNNKSLRKKVHSLKKILRIYHEKLHGKT